MHRDNPFESIEEFIERMEREFDADPFGTSTRPVSVDVRDEDGAFVVLADLPGFGKDALDVTLSDRTLRIEADHEESTEAETAEYVRRERRHESVSRTVRLPEPVAEGDLSATFANGVLTVTLPKRDAGGGTTIDIE